MEAFIEILKAILIGIVQGITEWLPVSSTGHMILLDDLIHLNVSESFMELFLVVIQLGSILAVLFLFFSKLCPLKKKESGGIEIKKETINLWLRVIVGCIPAGIAGVILDSIVDNKYVIAATLIIYGIAFIIIERINKKRTFKIERTEDITYLKAFEIGLFQMLALIPGTSRSGSTILGASILGVSRTAASEFSFFLAVPVMAGASLLKLLDFAGTVTATEIAVLITGTLVAFLVSLAAIKFLMSFVSRHSFAPFGVYRIILGIIVVIWSILS